MFHCCSRDEIVRASTELARSFATVGLLRHVTDATPIDMVCTYINRTGQPWGLKHLTRNINEWTGSDKYEGKQLTIPESHRADRVKYLPEGIIKMSKDYLIRAFWKQIDHLKSGACMRVASSYRNEQGHMVTRLFPKEVVKTLGGLRINQTSRIWDARNEIGALHSVCTPTMLDKPYWLKSTRYGGDADMSQFDVLRSNEERNLSALVSLLDNYCWQVNNRQQIPNDIEKGILLDLIECFLIMFGPNPFHESYVMRQVYEYARLQDSYVQRATPKAFSECACKRFDDRAVYDRYESWAKGVEGVIERLRNLTPQAAICAGYIGTDYWRGVMTNNSDVMKANNPQPLREVAIYLKLELDVQRMKEKYASRVIEAIRKGEFDPSNFNGNYHCNGELHYCGECDPCEPCPVADDASFG